MTTDAPPAPHPPPPLPPSTPPTGGDPDAVRAHRTRWRLRVLAVAAALTALAFAQQPGLLIADTKLDLAVAPGDFLRRALSLWDAEGAFGQLQNQGYGYLWPMGPFFWAGDLLGAPEWAVQRAWIALVMVVSFVGVVWLCRLLGVTSGTACLLAGTAYALSPRAVSLLGQISIEVWPGALAPWVLAFLVRGSVRGSPVAAAAASAAAVAMVGGVNAAATAAVLPLGALWLLTRTPGPRRRSLMTWWPVFTLLGTCWWLVPLLLLGAYSPPFLDYIESAEVTTLATPLFDALRGTSDWVAYVDPTWRAGNDLVSQGFWVVSGVIVLVLGLAGIVRRDQPHRRFLMLGLLVGLLMVTFGHTGATQGWWADGQQRLLDGALAPLRNVHKFDPVIRLCLVLGLAHAVSRAGLGAGRTDADADTDPAPARPAGPRTSTRVAAVGLCLVAVVAAAGPAFLGRIAPTGAYLGVPAYWEETTDWLAAAADDTDGGGRALLLPGSSFGSYVWGFTRDEPMQPLAASPWAVRNAIPLAPPGNVRMLDAVERRLAAGEGSPGLADYLRRAGVSHLVVRHDLQTGGRVPDPVLVEQALRDSPGLRPVASFGPEVGGETRLDDADGGPRLLVNRGWQSRFPAVRVWEVPGGDEAVTTAETPVVVGDPGSLLDLADLDVLGPTPTLLAVDLPEGADTDPPVGPVVLTDGLRRRETSFGAVHDNTSATLAPGEERVTGRPVSDYRVGPDERAWDRWRAPARLTGADSLGASSSGSDADNPAPVLPGHSPYAAVDGDPTTQWVSGRDTGGAPWLEVRLERPTVVGEVRVTLGDAVPLDAVVRVVTDTGSSEDRTLQPGRTATVTVPEGPTGRVRVEGVAGAGLAVSEVEVDGLDVGRVVDLPALPASWGAPAAIVLGEGLGHRSACVRVSGDLRCAAGAGRDAEEPAGLARTLELGAAGDYTPGLRVRARPGPALAERLQDGLPLVATTSTDAVEDAAGSAVAAVDGDPGTTWVADLDDPEPRLDLRWIGPRRITGLRLELDRDAPATPARSAVVRWPGGEQRVRLDERGFAELDPFRASRLSIELAAPRASRSLQFDGTATELGIGVTQVRLPGTGLLPQAVSQQPERFGCGSGPDVVVGGGTVRTQVVASRAQVLRGEQVPSRPCGGSSTLEVLAGRTTLEVPASGLFAPSAVVLTRSDLDAGPVDTATPTPLDLTEVDGDERTVGPLVPGDTVVVRENVNPGWELGADGAEPVVVDGWQQGWRLGAADGDGPDGAAGLRFAPQRVYALGLAAGALTLVLLGAAVVLLAVRRPRAGLAPLEERRVPRLLGAVVLAGVVALLAGTPGLLVAAAAVVAHLALRRVPDAPRAVLVGAGLVVAGALYWARPLGSLEGWAGGSALAQLAVVVSLVWAGLEVLDDPRPGGPTLRRRIAGTSTHR